MLQYYPPLKSGSASERRAKKRDSDFAQLRRFDAELDADELKTAKQQAAVVKRKGLLKAHRAQQLSSQEQKALVLVAGEVRVMKRRAKEDQDLRLAHAQVANLRADAGLAEVEDDVAEVPQLKKAKGWSSRPDFWIEIVKDFEERQRSSPGQWHTAVEGTMEFYDQELAGKSVFQNYKKLLKWSKEKNEGKVLHKPGNIPVYGRAVDTATYNAIIGRNSKGLSMDRFVMKQLLITQLTLHGKADLLVENGGKFSFGDAWATRFLKRWKLRRRVATTKMREKPADFDAKVEEY